MLSDAASPLKKTFGYLNLNSPLLAAVMNSNFRYIAFLGQSVGPQSHGIEEKF